MVSVSKLYAALVSSAIVRNYKETGNGCNQENKKNADRKFIIR